MSKDDELACLAPKPGPSARIRDVKVTINPMNFTLQIGETEAQKDGTRPP